MKAAPQIQIEMKTSTQDKLACLNQVLLAIDSEVEHFMWNAGASRMGEKVSQFDLGDEPVVLWSVTDTSGNCVGHLELHNNQFGWVIARVWTRRDFRRHGLARLLYRRAFSYGFAQSETIGVFCFDYNYPSRNLILNLGFEPDGRPVHPQIEFFVATRAATTKAAAQFALRNQHKKRVPIGLSSQHSRQSPA